MEGKVRLFHKTESEFAECILRDGFRDDINNSLKSLAVMDQLGNGVFFSDIPVGCTDGAKGETLIEALFDLPLTELSEKYEHQYDDGLSPFREFQIPAAIVNAHARLRILGAEEADELETWAVEERYRRWRHWEESQKDDVKDR